MSTKAGDTKGILRTIPQERQYPDPQTLPVQPSWQQPRPQLTLSQLIPGNEGMRNIILRISVQENCIFLT